MDDTIIFCPTKEDFLLNITTTIITFFLASGLKVNYNKSALISLNCNEQWVLDVARKLHCEAEKLPLKYLRFPIGVSSNKIELWSLVIAIIEDILASSKGLMLSMAGRVTLIGTE